MRKMKFWASSSGHAGLPLIVILTLSVFIMAGWSFALSSEPASRAFEPPGHNENRYRAYSLTPGYNMPWWSNGKDSFGTYQPAFNINRRPAGDFSYSLPNTGLKSPEDIQWPYSGDLSYDMTRDTYAGYSIYPGKGGTRCVIAYTSSGGELDEILTYRYGSKSSGQSLKLDITGEYDHSHKTEEIIYKIALIQDNREIPEMEIRMTRENDKLHWKSMVYEYPEGSDPSKAKKKFIRDYLEDAPKDGFFFYTGSDSPACIALMLASIDLDSKEPPSVWVLCGGQLPLVERIDGDITQIEPIFTRMTILPLEKSGEQLSSWWNATRRFFYDYKPGADIRTFILFEEGINLSGILKRAGMSFALNPYLEMYNRGEDLVIAYVDSSDRLVRVEQIGAVYCTAVELTEVRE